MKSSLRPKWSFKNLITALFLSIVGLTVICGSLELAEAGKENNCFRYNFTSSTAGTDDHELLLSSADFSVTHQQGHSESTQRIGFFSLQHSKVLRSSIFDVAQQDVLTQRLAWFTQPIYSLTLSPVWNPSIPIACRKLVI